MSPKDPEFSTLMDEVNKIDYMFSGVKMSINYKISHRQTQPADKQYPEETRMYSSADLTRMFKYGTKFSYIFPSYRLNVCEAMLKRYKYSHFVPCLLSIHSKSNNHMTATISLSRSVG